MIRFLPASKLSDSTSHTGAPTQSGLSLSSSTISCEGCFKEVVDDDRLLKRTNTNHDRSLLDDGQVLPLKRINRRTRTCGLCTACAKRCSKCKQPYAKCWFPINEKGLNKGKRTKTCDHCNKLSSSSAATEKLTERARRPSKHRCNKPDACWDQVLVAQPAAECQEAQAVPWMFTIAGLTVTIGAPLRYGNDARVVMGPRM